MKRLHRLKTKVIKYILGNSKEAKSNSSFKHVLLIYLLISLCLFFVFTSMLLIFMQKNYLESIEIVSEESVDQAYDLHKTVIMDIYSYCFNMLDNANVRNLLYSDEYTVETALFARETYNDIKSVNSLIDSLYFINYRTQTVLDKAKRVNLVDFDDQDIIEYIKQMSPSSSPTLFIPRILHVTTDGKEVDIKVLSFVYYTNLAGALVINLDYDRYCELVGISSSNTYITMTMINSDGIVMASSDSLLLQMNYSDDALFKAVKNQLGDKGTFEYTDEYGKYTITYMKKTTMGVTIISKLNHEFFYPENTMLGTTIFSSVVYFMGCLILTFMISWVLYKPFHKLRKFIAGNTEISNDPTILKMNDYEFLMKTYDNILDKNKTLHKQSLNYKIENENQILQRLLNNKYMEYFYKATEYNDLNQTFRYPNFSVFLVSSLQLNDVENAFKETSLFKFVIKNVICELFDKKIDIRYIELGTPRAVFIINHEVLEKEKMCECLSQAHDFFNEYGKISLIFGVGTTVLSLDEISVSYEDARDALLYNLMNSTRSISFREDITFINSMEEVYPYEQDSAIIAAMKALNREAMILEIDTFFKKICEFHYDPFIQGILQLNASLQRFAHNFQLTYESIDSDEMNYNGLELSMVKTFFSNNCDRMFLELYEAKCQNAKNINIVNKINQIVADNLCDPNLSIVMLADEVHLSVNYLRNVYKESSKESLSNYIIQRKLELTCKLLSETDEPIQDISERLGFTTKNYFFTFFKKHMGITPTQFRSKNKND